MSQICLKNVSLGYTTKTVLKDLNFEISRGDYLCIVGENGSGKTTLIKTLLHLIPALSGKIEFGCGCSFKCIGYMPQTTEVQSDFPASVMEIVLSGCRTSFRPFYNKKDRERADLFLQKLGISHLSKKSFRELSGGQQRRVLLCRALCAAEDILLLDEPCANLDSKAEQDFYDIIDLLNKENNMTVIMVTHEQKILDRASHILRLYQGSYEFSGRDAR